MGEFLTSKHKRTIVPEVLERELPAAAAAVCSLGAVRMLICLCFSGYSAAAITLPRLEAVSSPPPEEGLTWALAGLDASGAVSVVDVGDGERWLRPLHSRALRAVLLWRAAPFPRRASAPRWLQQSSGYVLAAHDPLRLSAFLSIECADVLELQADYMSSMVCAFVLVINILLRRKKRNGMWRVANLCVRSDKEEKIELQLTSSAPVVLALARVANVSDTRLTLSTRRMMLPLLKLWNIHQSFRGLLLVELETARWSGYTIDPHDPSSAGPRLPVGIVGDCFWVEGECIRWAPQGALSVAALARLRERNVGGARVLVISPRDPEFFSADVHHLGIPLRTPGPQSNMMRELARRLNIAWTIVRVDNIFTREERVKEDWKGGRAHYERYGILKWRGLALGHVDVDPQFNKGIPGAPTTLLASSIRRMTFVILVPRATLLPSWSLPLRALRADLWLALVLAAIAYSLTWRIVTGQSMGASVAAALRAFSSSGGTPQERATSTPQRLQLAGALLGSAVVIVALYQSRLFTLITKPESYSEMETLAQLLASKLPIVSIDMVPPGAIEPPGDAATSSTAPTPSAQQRREVVAVSAARVREEMKRGRRFAWVLSTREWEDVATNDGLDARLHPLRHTPPPILVFRNVRRNWPWTVALEQCLLNVEAAGLPAHWDANYHRVQAILARAHAREFGSFWGGGRNNSDESGGNKAFAVEDLRAPFQLLGAGLALAVFTFVAEFVHGHRSCFCARTRVQSYH